MNDAIRHVAFGLAAREAVRAFVEFAARHGAHVIAIKGFHVAELGGDPSPRTMGDVDLVIAGDGAHERIIAALRAERAWEVGPDEDHSIPVRGPFGVALDLHRSPLPRYLGRLDARKLHERARPARSVPQLLVPDPVDGAVLALVHYTKDRLGTFGSSHALSDLETFLTHGASPSAVAKRIAEHGLRRAALIALMDLELSGRSPRIGALVSALNVSPRERRIAGAVARAMRALGARAPRSTWWAVRLLPDTPAQAAQGLLWQARVSLLGRWRTP